MLTLEHLMSVLVHALASVGATHPSFGAISHHFGEILTKHWKIVITWRG